MSEQDRIAGMLEAGKLNAEEAADILAALGELEAAEETLSAAQAELNSGEVLGAQPCEQTAASNPSSESTASSSAAEPSSVAPTLDLPDLDWLRIDFMAGDIIVSADAELSEPVIDEGNVRLERDGDDFVVQSKSSKTTNPSSGNFLEDMGGWLSKMASRVGDVTVRVPPRYGVDLKSKAGDIDVTGIAFLKADLMAGDIDIREVGGLSLSATAGDMDISFAPQTGQHRIEATAGDVDIRLAKSSSVTVTAKVGMGEIDVLRKDGGEVTSNRSLTGGASAFTVGSGAAQLDISLSAGEVDITVEAAPEGSA